MITAEKIAYTIRHVLKKLNVKTDDLKDGYIYSAIPNYVQRFMQDEYRRTRVVDPAWVMNLGKVETVKVNSGDDPNVLNGSVVLDRYILPSVTSFDDKPYVKFYNGLRTEQYTMLNDFEIFFAIYRADRKMLEKYPSSIICGGNAYFYPSKGLQVQLIPANPFDCKIRKAITNPKTGLPLSYWDEVTETDIPYTDSDIRDFTIFDKYPISESLVNKVVQGFIELEFNINKDLIIDKMQDGNDESQRG